MEPFFQIQSGIYKNKRFPLKESKSGHANFTPSILKKAIFDKIESEELSGLISIQELVFVDLFAGSAQIGIEALSRGFKKVHLFEIDRNRFKNIIEITGNLQSGSLYIHSKDSFRYYDILEEGESGVYFLDPPFTFWKENKISYLIENLVKIKKTKEIFIQSPTELNKQESRRFGSNYLTEIKNF